MRVIPSTLDNALQPLELEEPEEGGLSFIFSTICSCNNFLFQVNAT